MFLLNHLSILFVFVLRSLSHLILPILLRISRKVVLTYFDRKIGYTSLSHSFPMWIFIFIHFFFGSHICIIFPIFTLTFMPSVYRYNFYKEERQKTKQQKSSNTSHLFFALLVHSLNNEVKTSSYFKGARYFRTVCLHFSLNETEEDKTWIEELKMMAFVWTLCLKDRSDVVLFTLIKTVGIDSHEYFKRKKTEKNFWKTTMWIAFETLDWCFVYTKLFFYFVSLVITKSPWLILSLIKVVSRLLCLKSWFTLFLIIFQ